MDPLIALISFIQVATSEEFVKAVYNHSGLVLVEYWSPVCEGCAYMHEVVYRDARVVDELRGFKLIGVNVYKLVVPIVAEPCNPVIFYSPDTGLTEINAAGDRFRPYATPTIAVLAVDNGSAKLVAWMVGAADPRTFAEFLRRSRDKSRACLSPSPRSINHVGTGYALPQFVLGVAAAAIAGVLSIAAPCVFPLIAGVAATLVARRNMKIVFLGIFLSFVAISSMVVAVAGVSSLFKWLGPLVAALAAVVSGMLLVSDKLANLVMSRLGTPIQTKASRLARGAGDLLFGAALGVSWAPCAAPVAIGVMSLITLQLGLIASMLLTTVYAVSALATLYAVIRAAARARRRLVLGGRLRALERMAGFAVIFAGLAYLLVTVVGITVV